MVEKREDTLTRKGNLQKPASRDSTDSTTEEVLKSPKDVLALGQGIVRQLELASRGEVLARWLAHHLAEVMAEADDSIGTSKEAAEARAVQLILKLWGWRRALPEPVDPLGGYREAIKVLGQLMPKADPWERYRLGTYDDSLQKMFKILSTSVVHGLLLTKLSRTRPITEEESKCLEEEERYLQSALEHWMQFTPVDPEAATDTEVDGASEQPTDSRSGDDAPDEQTALHAAILANLERMQIELAELLTRWRGKTPHESEIEET